MKTYLKRIDIGMGKVWEYRLSVFGKEIVPLSRFATLKEVALNTWWWIKQPSKWW